MSPRCRDLSALFTALCLLALCGCATVIEIRIQNNSTLDYSDVSVAGQPYGDLAAGETSEYRSVKLWFRYAVIRLTADGHKVNAQTLNLGAKRFTHRIDIIDLAAGHLAIEIVRD